MARTYTQLLSVISATWEAEVMRIAWTREAEFAVGQHCTPAWAIEWDCLKKKKEDCYICQSDQQLPVYFLVPKAYRDYF